MHAFIVTGGTPSSRKEFVSTKSVGQIELIQLVAEKSSITIKQVQDLSGPLSISARIPRIIYIEEANKLTIPAQNALLKMLEEPPENTDFYLTCNSQSSFLPTIRSRSKLITLESEVGVEDPAILADLKNILALSSGDRIASIVKRDRAETVEWLTNIEQALRTKLHEKGLSPASYNMLSKIAQSALSAHLELTSNCSVSLVTQNFYLTLPHTRSQS